jgi:hypothetical protein
LYEVSTISTVPSAGAILSNYLHCPLPFSIVHFHFWECYLDQLLYVYWYFSCLRRHHTSLAVVSCLRLQYLLELTINLQIVSKERVSQIGGSSHVCLTRIDQASFPNTRLCITRTLLGCRLPTADFFCPDFFSPCPDFFCLDFFLHSPDDSKPKAFCETRRNLQALRLSS